MTNAFPPPFTGILVPVDFSGYSDAVLRYAVWLAREPGSHVELLHVVEDPVAAGGWGSEVAFVPNVQEILDNLVSSSENRLSEMKRRVAGDNTAIITRVVIGSPARTIVERAEKGGFNLIVMGTHGRTGISHVMMGSVAERVVRHAPCPVLTVRTTAEGASTPGPAAATASIAL